MGRLSRDCKEAKTKLDCPLQECHESYLLLLFLSEDRAISQSLEVDMVHCTKDNKKQWGTVRDETQDRNI